MKCTGYEKNTAVSDLMDSDFVHANSVVAENLAYVAEPLQDNASDFGDIRFGSPFGPSYALRVWTKSSKKRRTKLFFGGLSALFGGLSRPLGGLSPGGC